MEQGTFVIVRANGSGVWAGNLGKRNGNELTLHNAIRLWRWYGANTCSELAQFGTARANECKFANPVDEVLIFNVLEIIQATPEAEASLKAVKVKEWWR